MSGTPPMFCMSVVSGTLLVYEILCTLDQEIAYVWLAPWTLLTFLFFLNRYLPFVGIFMGIQMTQGTFTAETCAVNYQVIIWFLTSCVIISEVVLLLRTYVLWDRKRWVLILLSGLLISTTVAGLLFTQADIKNMNFIPFPVGLDIAGCNVAYKDAHRISLSYALVLVTETVIMVLTVFRAFRHLPRVRSSWIFELYKTGCLFYIYLFVVSLSNLVLPLFAPSLKNLLASLQVVLHSIFSTRVLLLVLSQRKRRSEPGLQTSDPLRSIREVFTTVIDTLDISDASGSLPDSGGRDRWCDD